MLGTGFIVQFGVWISVLCPFCDFTRNVIVSCSRLTVFDASLGLTLNFAWDNRCQMYSVIEDGTHCGTLGTNLWPSKCSINDHIWSTQHRPPVCAAYIAININLYHNYMYVLCVCILY